MTTQTKRFAASFAPNVRAGTRREGRTFYERAKKHVIKGRRGGPRDLSRRIDEVAYGG